MLIPHASNNLKKQFYIKGCLVMYVGNLEAYQGIDLLLESFSLVLKELAEATLVIIGGDPNHIQRYRGQAKYLGIEGRVHWLGSKPVEALPSYLSQADILVSPRVQGVNTPMKLYSYLGSGKATLVTDLPTHTQLVDETVAMIAVPEPKAFSKGMLSLIRDANLRSRLGIAGQKLIEENFSRQAFCDRLNSLYDWLENEIGYVSSRTREKSSISNI
ncbi:hypothetical protein XM38_041430 [Halomicronema hongdechloris C2206]|uniref:Glycosyl transferase family 1 domain-containing protein n=1 Tax=Halomicronema hongdechloris C2206 TaxID=1641165 RepID=A0A1V8NJX6_9CYAN|nr:glycosyltransferase family 4 protein [Halomicronema hongdechloris]ASC73181.1 hypothetical protein XM38_041430 [Halomicronema hongdechloris C2206]